MAATSPPTPSSPQPSSLPVAPPVDAPTAIEVDGLVKEFTLRHNRSLKELAMAKIRRKPISDSFRALHGVDLHVQRGESVALLGFNGSGKSTLLKLISGVMQPDEGSVGVRGRIAGLIEVGAGFHPDLTGRENVYLNGAILGMDEATIAARFDDIVAFSEIERFIDTEVKFYSSGMFLRLAFAVAVHTDPEIFLIDEILSVGDEPFQKKCLARIEELRAEGRTLVIVSHDLDMVADLCTRGVLLEQGKVVADDTAVRVVARMRGQDPAEAEEEHARRRREKQRKLDQERRRAAGAPDGELTGELTGEQGDPDAAAR